MDLGGCKEGVDVNTQVLFVNYRVMSIWFKVKKNVSSSSSDAVFDKSGITKK